MERTTQQASDGINPLTASGIEHNKQECDTNIEILHQANHPSENVSDATDAFTSSEFEAIKNRHKEWWGRLKAKNTGPLSEATNALTTSEIKQSDTRSKKENANDGSHALSHDLLQQGEASEHGSPISSHASNESIATDKTSSSTQTGLLEQCGPGIKRATLRLNTKSLIEVSVQAIGLSVTDALYTAREELVLTQSQHDFGFKLQVRSSYQNQKGHPHKTQRKTCMDLIFDPNSDVILLCNTTGLSARESIIIRQLPLSRQNMPTNLGFMGRVALNVSSYGIYISKEHIFDITILPRRYISFITEPRNQPRRTNKRSFEPSSSQQDSTANKRAKLKETSEESSASTIFETAPTHPLIDEPAFLSTLSNVSNTDISVVSGLCHPLEELQLDDTLKIVSATREEDYELTRRADLSVQRNSLVYKAHHSKIPGRLVVVKIWRSKLDFTADSASALNVSSVGRYWLNEVKNHFEIGLHPAIATCYAADARLLSVYIEYINAPNLLFYCERRRNTYCKLDYSDARRVLYSMADALSFIHRKGVTHDDIKPANILYSKDRGPVLIDFGWSSTGDGHCAGSPWYIPPEYKQSGKRGSPGDIFAFGVVMLFLLRLIPLPELQSPPLRWQISHLRKVGPDARKAIDKMNQWLEIVDRATDKLNNVPDNVSDKSVGYVVGMVQGMLDFEPGTRISAHELFHDLREL
ncbi:hypothetical protein TGAM01_v211031 [Trichoderma gamsii]|uniref:Protein kinase domain-containing protein n=1 Tax=Trichoderma gamsii TaxID=398673 RepID=A0A2P4Z739_9HYPO|nr:hypothetical protein TGAM01_v211031 [Trichoderma gamsii]PON20108.1 hypothetical protein TGAM01_v211031 [Trichoderma gamsii]